MKRFGNIYERIISIDNLELADLKARKGKSRQRGIRRHDLNREENIKSLHLSLKNKTFRTSEYKCFTIRDPKERVISRLPYYPDRIAQHAVMNIVEEIFVSVLTTDTYNCIKGRGIHLAVGKLKTALSDRKGTEFCLKIDIRKFYPSVNPDILKGMLRKKFKDQDFLWLMDEIIDSSRAGLPVGNYLSQNLANFYLTYFDHWVKEQQKVKYYFRYADDMVFLADSKLTLHKLLSEIRIYLKNNLKLDIKPNYQIFPVESRGIDFLGYVFRHDYIKVRKSIKQNFARKLKQRGFEKSFPSYEGWLKHGNCINLKNKLLNGKRG